MADSNKPPIYGFKITDDGSLEMKTYADYDRVAWRRTTYRFKNGYNIVTKTEEQMDRYISGYLYTFDPDPERAMNIIKSTLQDKSTKLYEEMVKINATLAKIEACEERQTTP